MYHRSIIGAALVLLVSVGCAQQATTSGPASAVFDSTSFGVTRKDGNWSAGLYVGNWHTDPEVYPIGEKAPVRQLAGAAGEPMTLRFGPDGDLYQAVGGTIFVYVPGQYEPHLFNFYTAASNITDVCFGPHGHFYVTNTYDPPYQGSVIEFKPGQQDPIRVITTGIDIPGACELDKRGNLFVANTIGESVTVYAPGSLTPARTITAGMARPISLAFGPSGNLYVGNQSGGIMSYAPGSTTVLRDLGDSNDIHIAFDSRGNLYGDDQGSIQVWAPGASKPFRSITQGIDNAFDFAIDSDDDVFVANIDGDNVTAYKAGQTTVWYTVTEDLSNPSAVAVGPR